MSTKFRGAQYSHKALSYFSHLINEGAHCPAHPIIVYHEILLTPLPYSRSVPDMCLIKSEAA